MFKPFSKSLLTTLAGLFIAAFMAVFMVGTANAQTQTPASAKKSSASVSCDGALDIVPTKAMTFTRKRRQTKNDGKQQTNPADSTAQPKPAGNSKPDGERRQR